jgi:probable rRNA maturation factor
MISINFQDVKKDKLIETAIKKAALKALESTTGEVTFILCTDEFIQNLNKQYRGVDRSTDVLSFPSDEVDPDSGDRYLGDVIISIPHAEAQAKDAAHSVTDEISMLAIHGTLHLLGYDHSTIDEKTAMWQKQEELLSAIGIQMDKYSGDE